MLAGEICKVLQGVSLFDTKAELEHFVREFPPREMHLSAGESYDTRGELGVIVSGKADIVKNAGGKRVYLKTVGENAVFGLAGLFAEKREYISSVVAKGECHLLLFGEDFVGALIKGCPDFSVALVKLLCEKVRYLNRRIDYYTCADAEEKLWEYLRHSADERGEVVSAMSRVSSTLDIGRASLYRALTSLEEKGYIAKDGKKIIILQ